MKGGRSSTGAPTMLRGVVYAEFMDPVSCWRAVWRRLLRRWVVGPESCGEVVALGNVEAIGCG